MKLHSSMALMLFLKWQYIVSLDDPINAWQIWKKLFLDVADKHAPVKQEE